MSPHFDTRLATGDPRLTVANAYLFDAAPERTVMVMTCNTDAAGSAPAAFHPAALYEFRFDTTGNGRDDTGFQLRFTDPIQHAEQGPRQDFTVHYITGADLDVEPAQPPMLNVMEADSETPALKMYRPSVTTATMPATRLIRGEATV